MALPFAENINFPEYEEEEIPNTTYRLDPKGMGAGKMITEPLEAVKQAVFLMLNTQRAQHAIYSIDYGFEKNDLIGEPMPFVMSEIKRRIYETLTQDDRIVGVEDVTFDVSGNDLRVGFQVYSMYGEFAEALEVELDV